MSKSYVGLMGCPNCGKPTGVLLDRRMRETFEDGKVYAGDDLCDECKEKMDEAQKIVEQGGVYFRCSACGTEGAIRLTDSSRELVEYIRGKGKVGVEFNRCSQHTPVES